MSYFGIPIRNGLPIGLGSVAPLASGGGSPFSPLSLFSGGTPGAWYDPSDYSTLFQDSAGTTPVTAVEQPVGLMLDKSQGLVLGPQLITNGDFSSGGTGWTADSGWTISSGAASTAAGFTGALYQTISVVAGRLYQISFDLSAVSGGGIIPSLFGGTTVFGPTLTAAQRHTVYLFAASGNTDFRFFKSAAGAALTVDNISVKELPGNHAFQATSASRPVLSARYNLLTKTEQFDDAAWLKSSVTLASNTAVAPDGTVTADTFTPAAGVVSPDVNQQASSLTSGVSYVFSVYLKDTGNGSGWWELTTISPTVRSWFDVRNGIKGTGSGSIEPVGNGWYRCNVITTMAATSTFAYISPRSANGNSAAITATAVPYAYIWGADFRPSNQSSIPYQRVNTATDYATTGFLPYLKFDGVDDSLSTNSISFTSTDKMSVFAGVRKLSSAGFPTILESSANVGSNAGTFNVFASGSTSNSPGYIFGSRGTSAVTNASVDTGYAAPVTNILTGIGNIAADTCILRVNGTQVASNAADQGTGNYGNFPLYIGSRAGTSLPFNGQLYSMVIVGKAVTAGELTSTETYVNQKTGAYA
jgi:hypothetical protein